MSQRVALWEFLYFHTFQLYTVSPIYIYILDIHSKKLAILQFYIYFEGSPFRISVLPGPFAFCAQLEPRLKPPVFLSQVTIVLGVLAKRSPIHRKMVI